MSINKTTARGQSSSMQCLVSYNSKLTSDIVNLSLIFIISILSKFYRCQLNSAYHAIIIKFVLFWSFHLRASLAHFLACTVCAITSTNTHAHTHVRTALQLVSWAREKGISGQTVRLHAKKRYKFMLIVGLPVVLCTQRDVLIFGRYQIFSRSDLLRWCQQANMKYFWHLFWKSMKISILASPIVDSNIQMHKHPGLNWLVYYIRPRCLILLVFWCQIMLSVTITPMKSEHLTCDGNGRAHLQNW